AHEILRVRSGAPHSQQGTGFGQKLCAKGGKNKRNPNAVWPVLGRGEGKPRAGGAAAYSSVRSSGGASPRSRSLGSSGSSSSRSAGSSEGMGTEKPAGSDFSMRPAPLSSSRPGRSASASSPKCDRNPSVVP